MHWFLWQNHVCFNAVLLKGPNKTVIQYWFLVLSSVHRFLQILGIFWWYYVLGVWYATTTTENRKAAQGVISTAQKIIGCPLPPLEAIARSSCLRKTSCLTSPPSCWRLRSIRSYTARLTTAGVEHPQFHCTFTMTINGYSILYILFCAEDDETFNIFTILSLGTFFCRLVILYLSKMLFDLLSVNISCKMLI